MFSGAPATARLFCWIAGRLWHGTLSVVSDRLAELRRQRALVQQHLDWLDREIALNQSALPRENPPEPGPAAHARAPVSSVATDAYTPDPAATQQEVKRGCLLWLIAGLLLLGTIFAAIYFLAYGDRPLLFMERE